MKKVLLSTCLCTLLFVSCKKDEFENLEQKETKIETSSQLPPGATLVTDQRIIDSLNRCYKNPDSVMKANANRHKKENLLEEFLRSATEVVKKIFQPTQKDPLTYFFNIAHLNPTSFFVATAIGVLNSMEGKSITDSRVQKFFGTSYSGAILKLVFDYKSLPSQIKNGKYLPAAYTITRKQYVNAMKPVYDDNSDKKVENPNALTAFTKITFPQKQEEDEYTLYLQSANGRYSLYLKGNDMVIMEKTENKTSICVRNGKNLQLKNVPRYTEHIVSKIYTQDRNSSVKTDFINISRDISVSYVGWTWELKYLFEKNHYFPSRYGGGGTYEDAWVQKRVSVIGQVYKAVCFPDNNLSTQALMCVMLQNNGDFIFVNQTTGEVRRRFSKGFFGDINGNRIPDAPVEPGCGYSSFSIGDNYATPFETR